MATVRGEDKTDLAKQLGAAHYIDSRRQNVAEALRAFGGAKVVLATATDGHAMGAAVDGLGLRGELILAGISMDGLAPVRWSARGRTSPGWRATSSGGGSPICRAGQ